MRPTITEEHIQLSKAVARTMSFRMSWRDVSDLEHDSLFGLYEAWRSWKGDVPFEFYAMKCMRWYMLRHAGYERDHGQGRLKPISTNLLTHENEAEEIGDTIADKIDFEALIEARFTLEEIGKALSKESQLVRDIVLRVDNDLQLSKKHGMKDPSSMRQIRKRFFRDFFKAHLGGTEFVSTGRK